MKIFPFIRMVNYQTLESLKNMIRQSVDEAPQYLKKIKENRQTIVYNKISDLNKWYTQIIGLDEVKKLQDKVINLQDRLSEVQEKRREVGNHLKDIRQKSLELQDQIHKLKRQNDMDRFLELMKEETEVLKLEDNVRRTFDDYDRTEREIFTAFCNAIRDSHEKQRAQMEYTRYFGLILGIAGSFLTFVYSTVRKHDIKKIIEKNMQNINIIDNSLLRNIDISNEETKKEIAKLRKQVDELLFYKPNKDIQSQLLNTNSNSENNTKANQEEYDTILKICGGLTLLFILYTSFSH